MGVGSTTVSDDPALPLSVEIAERGTAQRARLQSAMEVDPPRPGASATITSSSGTDGLNEPVRCEAALEAAIQAVSSADSATERTALVSPEAGPLEAPITHISEAPGAGAPEATGVS